MGNVCVFCGSSSGAAPEYLADAKALAQAGIVLVYGLPIDVSFFSTAWTEGKLIRYAYSFEQATRARRKPSYIPSVKVS